VEKVELRFTGHTFQGKPLLLDMSDVTFLVSLVLKMLLAVAKALDHREAKMALVTRLWRRALRFLGSIS
jgi:anti-anti-sigma regulatory factor